VRAVRAPENGVYICGAHVPNVRAGTLSTTGHSTNHVCNFDMSTKLDGGQWVRRGAALISHSLNDR
jgi:dynein heavy chain